MKRMKKHLSMMLVLVFLFTSIISPLENAYADQGYGGGEAAAKVVQAPVEQKAADVEQVSQLPAAGNADLPVVEAAEKAANGEALVKNVAATVDTEVEEAGALTKTEESSDASEAVVDENAPIVEEDIPAVVAPEQQDSQVPEAVYTELTAEQTVTEAVYSDLPVPQNVITTTTDTSITFKWDDVDGAASYDVEVDGRTENVEATEYVYNNLMPNTEHSFRVRAVNGASSSTWSSIVTATTLLAKPLVPANIKIMSTNSSITVSWDIVSDAIGYDIEVDGTVIDNGINITYVHGGLAANTQHTYRVRSKNEAGASDWTQLQAAITAQSIPGNLKAVSTLNNITLTWDSVAGATGYDLEIDGKVIDIGTDTAYVHDNLTANVIHSYRVRTRMGNDVGDWSNVCSKAWKTIINGGTISRDTTWDCVGSPYYVQGNITVSSGVVLTIMEKTIVIMKNQTGFSISGKINAKGKPDAPVVLTASTDRLYGGSGLTVSTDYWKGIVITSTGELNGEYIKVSYAGYTNNNYYYKAIEVQGKLNLLNSEVVKSNYIGIYVNSINSANGTVNIIGNTISDNNGQGIYIGACAGPLTIKDNRITNNIMPSQYDYPVYVYLGSIITLSAEGICNNIIMDNYYGMEKRDAINISGNSQSDITCYC